MPHLLAPRPTHHRLQVLGTPRNNSVAIVRMMAATMLFRWSGQGAGWGHLGAT
jgi:hypothetical protein